MNPCFFSRRRRRYICLQLSARLVIAVPTANISSVFKLLPGRLPAGTGKFEFQITVLTIARVNRGRHAHDAKFIYIQARAMDGVFFHGFRLPESQATTFVTSALCY